MKHVYTALILSGAGPNSHCSFLGCRENGHHAAMANYEVLVVQSPPNGEDKTSPLDFEDKNDLTQRCTKLLRLCGRHVRSSSALDLWFYGNATERTPLSPIGLLGDKRSAKRLSDEKMAEMIEIGVTAVELTKVASEPETRNDRATIADGVDAKQSQHQQQQQPQHGSNPEAGPKANRRNGRKPTAPALPDV